MIKKKEREREINRQWTNRYQTESLKFNSTIVLIEKKTLNLNPLKLKYRTKLKENILYDIQFFERFSE